MEDYRLINSCNFNEETKVFTDNNRSCKMRIETILQLSCEKLSFRKK